MNEKTEKHTLESITISKADLLRVLKENRESHNEVYNASVQAYQEAKRDEFERKLVKARLLVKAITKKLAAVTDEAVDGAFAGLNPFSVPSVPAPVSYEEYYEAAIRKVELSVHDEFTLDEKDFNQYVLNNWSWKGAFLSTATGYVTGVLGSGIYSGQLTQNIEKFNRRG